MENIIISIKKDVNRSPYHQYELNTCHFKGQHSRTGVDTVNHSVANYLSGTKFDKKDKFANNLSKKIDNWDKNPISDSSSFILLISNLIGAEGKESKYRICIEENKFSYSIRISQHNMKAINFQRNSNKAKNNVGVTFKPKTEASTFEDDRFITATEYVYYEEYTGSERLKQIAESILTLLQTGKYHDLANADHINHSPNEALGELLPLPMSLDGTNDLLTEELRLLNMSKLHDFGEKIGGSAKDRFHKKEKKEEHKEEKKKTNNVTIADLEALGYSRIAARMFYISNDQKKLSELKEQLDQWRIADPEDFQNNIRKQSDSRTELFINQKAENKLGGFVGSGINRFAIPYVAFSMDNEKVMKEDFDYDIVRKMITRDTEHWRDKLLYYLYTVADIPYSEKKRVFDITYENIINHTPIYHVLPSVSESFYFGPKESFKNRRVVSPYVTLDKYFFRDNAETDEVKNMLKDLPALDADELVHFSSWKCMFKFYADLYLLGRKRYYHVYPPVEKWTFQDKAGLAAKTRKGEDYRKGRNAETVDFLNTFGFRAVEFGESMPEKERWEHLNRAYDSFMDMCKILNILPENISLGGKLGICFGSRGKGGRNAPMAHYEPVKNVINLTRKMGAGSLAHEWFHAFDSQLVKYDDVVKLFAAFSEIRSESPNHAIRDFIATFSSATEKYNNNVYSFFRAALKLDSGKPYWSKRNECAARAFEVYVIKKLADIGCINEYLAQIPEPQDGYEDRYPYPMAGSKDESDITEVFDGIFKGVDRNVPTDTEFKTIR